MSTRKRTPETYRRKAERIKKWHKKREEERKKWSEERLEKSKPLNPVDYYLDQLKKEK